MRMRAVRPVDRGAVVTALQLDAVRTIVAWISAALLAAGFSACGGDEGSSVQARTLPPVSRASDLAERANLLLDGGPRAFKAQLSSLRGTPVVVNQWASWCGPCRLEFPFFRDLARKYDGKVAFLGVNSNDSRDAAADFLEQQPVPFPHYVDGDTKVARVFKGGRSWPTTAFYDRTGELAFTHQGQYRSAADLEADIVMYALGG